VLSYPPRGPPQASPPPHDPILRFRTHAYSVSVERRTGVGREAMPAVGRLPAQPAAGDRRR
jgi:hypothetical protein